MCAGQPDKLRDPVLRGEQSAQSPSAEDDVLSSAGHDQIAADLDERQQHQDEIERVHRQRTKPYEASVASTIWYDFRSTSRSFEKNSF
jgi:hypothetical protein